LELSRRPPEILLLGARVSQAVKCFSGGPSAHVGPDFRNQFHRGIGREAIDLGQIDAASELIQRSPYFKARFIVAGFSGGTGGGYRDWLEDPPMRLTF
jgi:hypothetical protein